MPNSELPQREPLIGPSVAYVGARADVVASFATALREWAGPPAAREPPCVGYVESPPQGAPNPLSI